MPLSLGANTFAAPKRGNSEEEYEDAFYPERPGLRRGRTARFAVADGASEGMLSGPWARILVRTFCRATGRPTRSSTGQVIARACDSWDIWKEQYLRRREQAGRPVQWWEEQGLSVGPFATLLGVVFQLHETKPWGRWDAVAMGDSCLFRVSGGRLAMAFPIASSSEFSSRPVLISSDPKRNVSALGRISYAGGTLARGDLFLLMTDALAAWFLREAEAGATPWEPLSQLGGDDDDVRFLELVDSLRSTGKMRNDDVTLTCVRVV